jgi:hypothetical protein
LRAGNISGTAYVTTVKVEPPQIVIDAHVLISALLSREGASFKLLQEEDNTVSATSLRLPDSLHKRVWELARREWVSLNQSIATALAETMSAQMTTKYLEKRAAIASLPTSVFCLSLRYLHSPILNCLTPHSISREDS